MGRNKVYDDDLYVKDWPMVRIHPDHYDVLVQLSKTFGKKIPSLNSILYKLLDDLLAKLIIEKGEEDATEDTIKDK